MTTAHGFAEIRARRALQEAGLAHDGPLTRAASTRNEVFIGPEHVVRFNQQPDERLAREAAVYELLGDRPWAPEVVAHGGRPGADYLIVTRRAGSSLSRCWPEMSPSGRREAVYQFTRCLRELHQVRVAGLLPAIDRTPHLLGGTDPLAPLFEGLQRLVTFDGVDRGLIEETRSLVAEIGDAIGSFDDRTMIHGDLTFENILWDGSRVTALIDFEWCRDGPPDLDLDVLARFIAIPHAHVSAEVERLQDAGDYDDVPYWMADYYPRLFRSDRLRDRLLVYALSFEVRHALSSPPPTDRLQLDEHHPYHRLHDLMATGGHVDLMLARLGLPTH